jgi:hypothetical protein
MACSFMPATRTQGITTILIASMFAPLGAQVQPARTLTDRDLHVVSVTAAPYNAVCDGTTDDSAALQRAFNAAAAARAESTLLFPPRACAFATPLVVGGPPAGPYDRISVRGVSEDASALVYTGSMSVAAAITIRQVAFSSWERLSVTQPHAAEFASHGAATGVLLDAGGGSGGTQTVALTFANLAVSGFKYGLVYGGGDAASEILCIKCRFAFNDVGWTASGFNSLNFLFFQVDLLGNRRGMEIGGDKTFGSQPTEGPKVYGGSTANNSECDFCLGHTFGITILEGLRAEAKGRFVKATGEIPQLVIRGNEVTPAGAPDDVVVELLGPGQTLMEMNKFAGKVSVGGQFQGGQRMSVVARQNIIKDSGGFPLTLPPAMRGLVLELTNNRKYDTGASDEPFRDYLGQVTNGLLPWMQRGSSVEDPAGGGLYLNAVRSIGLGTPVMGRNLRDTATFDKSGTKAYTFKRPVTVRTVARQSTTVRFESGALTPADIGKTLELPGANNTLCASPATRTTDSVSARILAVPTPTSATIAVQPQSLQRCQQSINVTAEIPNAVVGEDEPDANYLVVGVTCDANEIVAVRDRTATGFTLRSSNPASTATCAFLIVR